MEQVFFAKVMNARTMFKSKWRDLSVVHHHLEKELLESSYSALGSGKSEVCLVNKHTHIIKYALCTKIKLSSFFAHFCSNFVLSYAAVVYRGHPLGGSSTAHAPCRVSYVSFTNYVGKAR